MRRPRSVSARGTGVSSECKELFREIWTLCETRGLLGTNLRWRYDNLDKPGCHARFHRLPASCGCALVATSIGLSGYYLVAIVHFDDLTAIKKSFWTRGRTVSGG
jgi:hypothetical protein